MKIRGGRISRVHAFYDPTTHSARVRGYLRAPRTRPGPAGRAGVLQCQPGSGQCDLVIAFFNSGGIFENARMRDNSSSRVPRPHHVFYSLQRVPESTPHSPRTVLACKEPPMPPQKRPVRLGNYFLKIMWNLRKCAHARKLEFARFTDPPCILLAPEGT